MDWLHCQKEAQSAIYILHSNILKINFITVSPHPQGSRSKVGAAPGIETRGGEDGAKRRRVSSVKQPAESSSSGDEGLSALPCLVTLNPGVRIVSVAAGGRHTLALSGKFVYVLDKLPSTHHTIVFAFLEYHLCTLPFMNYTVTLPKIFQRGITFFFF